MIDYLKLWVDDVQQIEQVKALPFLSFTQEHDVETGELIKGTRKAQWQCFEIKLLSDTRLQIAGSLHKYWHRGNAGDFFYNEIVLAIDDLCSALQIDPYSAQIKNLECGFNICPTLNASQIIEEIIVYKNTRPNRPYEGNDEAFYFIEFAKGERYLKIYDKGRQYSTNNTLRVETKLMRTRELKPTGAKMLADLKDKNVLILLGRKSVQEFQEVVFNDATIEPEHLNRKERELYINLSNPNKWVHRQTKTSKQYRQEREFVELVNTHGQHRHSQVITRLLNDKLNELLNESSFTEILSKYNRKSHQPSTINKPDTNIKNHKETKSVVVVNRGSNSSVLRGINRKLKKQLVRNAGK